MTVARVAIVHPWLPRYRIRFFGDLVTRLAEHGVELSVLHGDPPPEVRARQDSASSDWARRLPSRHLGRGSRVLTVKSLPLETRSCDLLVLEQAIRNIETYLLLADGLRNRAQLAFWGHGRTYTKRHSRLEERVKDALTRRGRWFFAYTEGGAQEVMSKGFDHRRVTVVNNTLDTAELAQAAGLAADPQSRRRTAELLDVDPELTCLFVGGLDASKRLPFLLEAADRVSKALPGFRLLVAGDGDERHLVERAAAEVRWLRYVGRADAAYKAELAAVSQLLLVPGRVGLISIDSFVLRTPLVTTAWPWHAPEFEYLVPGTNAVVTDDDVASYAGSVVEHLRNPERIDILRRGCAASAPHYSLDQMVERFAGGVLQALAA